MSTTDWHIEVYYTGSKDTNLDTLRSFYSQRQGRNQDKPGKYGHRMVINANYKSMFPKYHYGCMINIFRRNYLSNTLMKPKCTVNSKLRVM